MKGRKMDEAHFKTKCASFVGGYGFSVGYSRGCGGEGVGQRLV